MKLLSLTVVLLALAGLKADEKINAPAPKAPEAPSIDGNYVCLQFTPLDGFGGPGGFGGGGPGGGGGVPTVTTRSEATINKGVIVVSAPTSTSGFSSRYAVPTEAKMTYTIDSTKKPMTIDVVTLNERNKKTTSQGIIEVNEDRITIALAKEGTERPKTTDEGDGITIYYFKKAPPPPRVEFKIVAMSVGKEAETEKELNKLAKEGYELVSTTNPAATDPKAAATTVHFVLKRTVKSP